MKNINIYLIRHAESYGNIVPDVIGQSHDIELTEKGIGQAEKLGSRLGKEIGSVDFIGCSTFKRAIQTAGIVVEKSGWKYEDMKINYTDALVEYNPGDWMGRNRSDVYMDVENLKNIAYNNMGFKFPNGESYHQVERRAASYIEDNIIYNKEILDLAEKKDVNAILFSAWDDGESGFALYYGL